MSSVTTPNGFPYSDPTDSVSTYPATGQALAEAVDDMVALQKSGSVSSGTLAANVNTDVSVTFTTAFPAAGGVPAVATGSGNIAPDLVFALSLTAVSRSGFTVRFRRSSGTAAVTCYWIASNVGNW